jgi:PAS domain S-box-containing protein
MFSPAARSGMTTPEITQKAQLDELFERAQEGIVLLDVEDRVLRINPEFTRIFGYAPDEAVTDTACA